MVHGNARDKSFFKSWKLPKIGKSSRGGGSTTSSSNSRSGSVKSENDGVVGARAGEGLSGGEDPLNIGENAAVLRRAASDETSDDILAKYRKKSGNPPAAVVAAAAAGFHSSVEADGSMEANNGDDSGEPVDERLLIDRMNVEDSYAFQDAKRKLRLVLSEADLTALANMTPASGGKGKSSRQAGAKDEEEKENEVAWFLRVQLAEANNLGDRSLVAQLHETLRCVSLFNAEECRKLISSLREDYRRRAPYLGYLVRCRQGLLNALAHQRRLVARLDADRTVCSRHLVSVCIRLFLENREAALQQYASQFKDSATPHDEKVRNVVLNQVEESYTSLYVGRHDGPFPAFPLVTTRV